MTTDDTNSKDSAEDLDDSASETVGEVVTKEQAASGGKPAPIIPPTWFLEPSVRVYHRDEGCAGTGANTYTSIPPNARPCLKCVGD